MLIYNTCSLIKNHKEGKQNAKQEKNTQNLSNYFILIYNIFNNPSISARINRAAISILIRNII